MRRDTTWVRISRSPLLPDYQPPAMMQVGDYLILDDVCDLARHLHKGTFIMVGPTEGNLAWVFSCT